MKRIGAIGDIHAEDSRLATVLRYFAKAKVDKVLAVGDIVDGPGDATRCCELLKQYQADAVMGNHDRWWLRDANRGTETASAAPLKEYLGALPPIREYETAAGPLLLCHGLGKNDMNKLTADDYGYALEANDELQELLATQRFRYVINGHTHRRMVRDFGSLTVINVGTLFREHSPCFAIVDFAQLEVVFYSLQDEAKISELERLPL